VVVSTKRTISVRNMGHTLNIPIVRSIILPLYDISFFIFAISRNVWKRLITLGVRGKSGEYFAVLKGAPLGAGGVPGLLRRRRGGVEIL